MNKEKENPLKGYSKEELQKFFNELEELQNLHMDISENYYTREWEGILSYEGMGIVRAFYVCLLKFYQEHGIPLPEDIDLGIPDEFRADFDALSEVGQELDYYDEEIYAQTTGDGLDIIIDMMRLSYADGIGDFEAVNGAEGYGGYSQPADVLACIYGEDWEDIVAEDAELTDEELEELPAPIEIAKMLSEADDEMEYYINNVIDMRVIKSAKVGKVMEQISIPKGVRREDYFSTEPLLNAMLDALRYINEMQQYYLSQYCLDVVRNGVWYSATISADVQEDQRVATMFSRVPGLLGMSWFVQEVCDRVLDGRIQLPKVEKLAEA